MRTQGGEGSKNGQIFWTSFMDGPLHFYSEFLGVPSNDSTVKIRQNYSVSSSGKSYERINTELYPARARSGWFLIFLLRDQSRTKAKGSVSWVTLVFSHKMWRELRLAPLCNVLLDKRWSLLSKKKKVEKRAPSKKFSNVLYMFVRTFKIRYLENHLPNRISPWNCAVSFSVFRGRSHIT